MFSTRELNTVKDYTPAVPIFLRSVQVSSAQAFGALRRPDESAHYCQLTLMFQLQHGILDATTWYRNCAGLADYFTARDRYRDAETASRPATSS